MFQIIRIDSMLISMVLFSSSTRPCDDQLPDIVNKSPDEYTAEDSFLPKTPTRGSCEDIRRSMNRLLFRS